MDSLCNYVKIKTNKLTLNMDIKGVDMEKFPKVCPLSTLIFSISSKGCLKRILFQI